MRVEKKLSANDLGHTGSHQAGIHVPKDERILNFFPLLNGRTKNPRAHIVMREVADNTRWDFNFIYYNNRLSGGTRNEYRLTCMTGYLRAVGASVGDVLTFRKDKDGSIFITIDRQSPAKLSEDGNTLVLSGGWRVINF